MSDPNTVVTRSRAKKAQNEAENAVQDGQSSSSLNKDKTSGNAGTAVKDNPSSSNPSKIDVFASFVESVGQSLKEAATEAVRPSSPLKTTDLAGIADYIKTRKPKNIIVMSGAGISTAAGIPDFRTPGVGLYSNLAEYDLEDPQDIFDLDFFKKNPEPFFKLAKVLFPKDVKPTPTHYFVRMLEKKGLLLRWFTQNIDSLEVRAGVNKEKVMAAHGSHASSTCLKCKRKYNLAWITKHLDDPDKLVPYCEKEGCDGIVKPDIIFFSESLPRDFFTKIVQDFPCCDLLIVMGTSLEVQPFASLVDEVDSEIPRLLLNREAVGVFKGRKESEGGRRATRPLEVCYGLGIKHSNRDVFHRGDCDDGVMALAEMLGWDAELEEMIAQGPPTSVLL
ncbi:hypothetical protein PENTCL1PPCAC_6053 [Pristionchus entomophagus]|uniref:Deacetylase sirtuin-type domain-containing protein n=1 Tax=Pristionchus entomophagus TaxID=358040 RepID=A0AAV5STF9_9BILA|nr:hypothetical protein PENTCL1PPCAC_6053 [Pristionchus entomophagus]